MKKILFNFSFFFCISLAYAQYGNITISEIKHLKDADLTYVCLLQSEKKENLSKINGVIKKAIEDHWTFTKYKILQYDEYKELQEAGRLDGTFVLTLSQWKTSSSSSNSYYYSNSIEIHDGGKAISKMSIENSAKAGIFLSTSFSKDDPWIQLMIPLYVKSLQQYLLDALEFNTTSIVKIAEKNGKILKERNLVLITDHLNKKVSGKVNEFYSNDYTLVESIGELLTYYSKFGEPNAILTKTYNPSSLCWYFSIIETVNGKILYWEGLGAMGMLKKMSKENLIKLQLNSDQ